MSDPNPQTRQLIVLPANAILADAVGSRIRGPGHLSVERNLIHCDTAVDGGIHVKGSVIGGAIVANGGLSCATLGGGSSETMLWVGAPPEANRSTLLSGEQGLKAAQAARAEREELIRVGKEDPDSLDHERRELLTLAEFELPGLVEAERALEWRVKKLRAFYDTGRVEVSRGLAAGLVLRVGLRPTQHRCIADLKGPLVLEAISEKPVILTLDAVDTPLESHEAFEPVGGTPTRAAAA